MPRLGELESVVMNVLWTSTGAVSVREVLTAISVDRPLAYTTVLTVLDNLHRKGWALRDKDGRAFRYRPSISREEAAARALREVLDNTADPGAALLHFVQTATEAESRALRSALGRHEEEL